MTLHKSGNLGELNYNHLTTFGRKVMKRHLKIIILYKIIISKIKLFILSGIIALNYNCEDASNENSLAFSGNFGVFSVGETASASSVMLSRLTAEAPLAEPDSANYQSFYSTDDENNYGAANEVDYGSNAIKIL